MRKKKEKKIDPRITQVRYNNTVSEDLPLCCIFDLDGTLSMMNGRFAYDGAESINDLPNQDVIDLLYSAWDNDIEIFLFSGRNSDKGGWEATERWLEKNNVPYDKLRMRKQGDFRKDTIVKEEMFQEEIQDKYRVWYVADDRDMMIQHWRDKGLTCLQVYYGDF